MIFNKNFIYFVQLIYQCYFISANVVFNVVFNDAPNLHPINVTLCGIPVDAVITVSSPRYILFCNVEKSILCPIGRTILFTFCPGLKQFNNLTFRNVSVSLSILQFTYTALFLSSVG